MNVAAVAWYVSTTLDITPQASPLQGLAASWTAPWLCSLFRVQTLTDDVEQEDGNEQHLRICSPFPTPRPSLPSSSSPLVPTPILRTQTLWAASTETALGDFHASEQRRLEGLEPHARARVSLDHGRTDRRYCLSISLFHRRHSIRN